MIKVLDSIQYHIWTDALHARQLARQTSSPSDRGAYVRWCVQTSWTTFENVCSDALDVKGLGNDFRRRFDAAIKERGLPCLDWGKGIWQKIFRIYSLRKSITHIDPSTPRHRLLIPLECADESITTLRDGIKAVSDLVGLQHPLWVDDDDDSGWKGKGGGFGGTAECYSTRAGARADDPNCIRFTYVLHGQEHLVEIAPPDTPPVPTMVKIRDALIIPVDSVGIPWRGTT